MRIRFSAPRGECARFRFLDSLHGALVNGWTACGAQGTQVVGRDAANWSFGAVGTATPNGFILKSVVVGAMGKPLQEVVAQLSPEMVRKTSTNGDVVDLSTWDTSIEEMPVAGDSNKFATLPAIMLSPLALSVRGEKQRWHADLSQVGDDLDEAVNSRLSRLTGREVRLEIKPDRLYLRANPHHSTLVRTRTVRRARPAFVIGMMCPLVISGNLEDIRSAWTLGIGEKNRYGFGCIGFAGRRP